MTHFNLKLTGRIIFSLPFIFFGLYRFWNMEFFVNLSPDWLPLPKLWISLVGIGLVAASISIIIGKYTYLASLMLAGMIFILASTVHVPNTIANWQDPVMRSISMALAMKDYTMVGGAIIIAGIFQPKRKPIFLPNFKRIFLNDNETFKEQEISI